MSSPSFRERSLSARRRANSPLSAPSSAFWPPSFFGSTGDMYSCSFAGLKWGHLNCREVNASAAVTLDVRRAGGDRSTGRLNSPADGRNDAVDDLLDRERGRVDARVCPIVPQR